MIRDIISFEEEQISEIRRIAAEFTKYDLWKVERYGQDISYLTHPQKQIVLDTKNRILSRKTPAQLLDDKIIQVALHANERSLKRVGSGDQTIIISLVDKVKRADMVAKAQFKGYPTLSYTIIESNDPENFKLPISFILGRRGRRFIKMITVAPKNIETEGMEASITELQPEMAKMLEEVKKRLKKD